MGARRFGSDPFFTRIAEFYPAYPTGLTVTQNRPPVKIPRFGLRSIAPEPLGSPHSAILGVPGIQTPPKIRPFLG